MSIERTGRDPEGDLSALEQRLGSWQPTRASSVVDRDRMLYEAGGAAAGAACWGRSGWLASACLALVALGLGVLLIQERGNRRGMEAALAAQIGAPKPLPAAPITPPAVAFEPESYLVLTQRMLAAGTDDSPLPASNPAPGRSLVHPEPALSPLDARRLGKSLDL